MYLDLTAEVFSVMEPSGRVYRVYANGSIEGFAPGSAINNSHPGLVLQAVSKALASSSRPTNKAAPEAGLPPSIEP